MDEKQIMNSVAYCGLVCSLCQPADACRCRSGNHCGKRLAPQGCYQYDCCAAKELNGCWECPDAPCGRDMLAPEKVKIRAFISCVKQDGLDRFAGYLAHNAKSGIVYHREGIRGDYDLESEDEVLKLLRTEVI